MAQCFHKKKKEYMYINEYQSNRRGSVLRHDKPRQVMRVGVTDTYLTAGTRTQYLLQYDKSHAVMLPDWLQHSLRLESVS
jgi:hypothetical protein